MVDDGDWRKQISGRSGLSLAPDLDQDCRDHGFKVTRPGLLPSR